MSTKTTHVPFPFSSPPKFKFLLFSLLPLFLFLLLKFVPVILAPSPTQDFPARSISQSLFFSVSPLWICYPFSFWFFSFP